MSYLGIKQLMYGTRSTLEIIEFCLSLERLRLKWWIQQVKQKLDIPRMKYILPADRVISNLPNYQSFGRQSKLRINPQHTPILKLAPSVTVNTNFQLSPLNYIEQHLLQLIQVISLYNLPFQHITCHLEPDKGNVTNLICNAPVNMSG